MSITYTACEKIRKKTNKMEMGDPEEIHLSGLHQPQKDPRVRGSWYTLFSVVSAVASILWY